MSNALEADYEGNGVYALTYTNEANFDNSKAIVERAGLKVIAEEFHPNLIDDSYLDEDGDEVSFHLDAYILVVDSGVADTERAWEVLDALQVT